MLTFAYIYGLGRKSRGEQKMNVCDMVGGVWLHIYICVCDTDVYIYIYIYIYIIFRCPLERST